MNGAAAVEIEPHEGVEADDAMPGTRAAISNSLTDSPLLLYSAGTALLLYSAGTALHGAHRSR